MSVIPKIRAACLSTAITLGVSSLVHAGTINGAAMADNDFIVVLQNGASYSTIYESQNGSLWNQIEQFSANVDLPRRDLLNCSINIIAWGDGSSRQGLAAILKGDAGTIYTGSGHFIAGQSNISSSGWANTNGGPTSAQIPSILSAASAPAQSFNGTVGAGTSPWGAHAFPPSLLTGVNTANFKWVWPSTNPTNVRRRVYSVFKAPCGKLLKPTPPPPPPVPDGEHFQCYMIQKGDRVEPKPFRVADQFGKSTIVLGKPVMLCNPSMKIHKDKEFPIINKERHLVCYNIVKQNEVKNQHLMVNTQFGSDEVISTRRKLFCAPAGKRHIKSGAGGRPRPQKPSIYKPRQPVKKR